MSKVKVFVYGRRQRRRRRRGYDNSSPDFRHGELKNNSQQINLNIEKDHPDSGSVSLRSM